MKKLVMVALATIGAVTVYRWYQERNQQKASWSTATDRITSD